MTNKNEDQGYPVGGGVAEKLDYLASKISSANLSGGADGQRADFRVRMQASREGVLFAAGFSLQVG